MALWRFHGEMNFHTAARREAEPAAALDRAFTVISEEADFHVCVRAVHGPCGGGAALHRPHQWWWCGGGGGGVWRWWS
eukprot:5804492-Prymnesium_polylepis.1